MSISRLLRAEGLARRSARLESPCDFNEMVRLANERRSIVWAPLPPPEASPEPPAPAPASAPPARAKAEPPAPAQPRAWHEDYCRWRPRTAADDAEDSEDVDEIDDPRGNY